MAGKNGKAKKAKGERKPAQTAAAWARSIGREPQWKALDRTDKTKVRSALKVLKRADRVREIAGKADERMARVQAIYDKKKAHAEKQWAKRQAVNEAEALIARVREELDAQAQAISAPVKDALSSEAASTVPQS